MDRLYITAVDLGLSVLCVNVGAVNYNFFNPADSNIANINSNWNYLYMKDLLGHAEGSHYAVMDGGNRLFDGQSFTLRYVDSSMNNYFMQTREFNFVATDQYDTWVCVDPDINIVMHVDRSTVASDAYSFAGQIAMQINSNEMPVISGPIVCEGGLAGDPAYDEGAYFMGSDGEGQDMGVELVSDDMVIWHVDGKDLVFHRI